MKLIHLSDLHLGKRVNEFSMLEDQAYILEQILTLVREEAPQAVLIAGDVYDRPLPGADAVELCDDFLVRLAGLGPEIFLISGNHDSAERLAFGGRLMEKSGVHLAPVYTGRVEPYTLTDPYGPVDIYLLPFIKPAHVRHALAFEPESYTQALEMAISQMPLRPGVRRVLAAHQFVTGAQRSDSEEVSVGGLDNVDASVFAPFTYTALGHIHRPQNLAGGRVRYCGSPLKYSFSEAGHPKSLTVAELGEGDSLTIRTLPLTPRRDMVELRGRYQELMRRDFYQNTTWREDYLHITLTDEEDVPGALTGLRTVYRNLMRLDYDNARTRARAEITAPGPDTRSPLQLLEDFYRLQNNTPLSEEQRAYAQALIESVWEEQP
ncbi:exonuclease SbcCD subunit D [Fournierella massiliensis]|nr:exonuclease SbcCD subunit D [Fournierella massiliensis]MCF2557858.1 exonuclease SbcCD subunit D [Fournierella massiliensis]